MSKIKARVRALWKSAKVRSRVLRFARLVAATLVASGVVDSLVHGTATRASVIAAVVGAVEVAFRQVVPPGADLEAAIAKVLSNPPVK